MEASLPASHNSPGPPGVTLHGATMDEDSQESMTLKNALAPLPDTQRDSPEDDHSSPTERDGGVQLLSRPQNMHIDPGESFSWGKPVKIIPGKFSRPVLAKSTVGSIKEKSPITSPVVKGNPSNKAPDSIAIDSAQLTPSVTREFGHVISPNSRHVPVEESSNTALPGVEDSLAEENCQLVANHVGHLTRVQTFARRPPFDDYQPRSQHPDGRDQEPGTHSSHARQLTNSENLGKAETQQHGAPQVKGQVPHQGTVFSEQGRGSHHSVNQRVQQYQLPTAVQTDGPRHRVSLPNDTSVSPVQISQHLPRQTSQHEAVHEGLPQNRAPGKSPFPRLDRSMRDVRQVSKTKTPTRRPSSRSSTCRSNISKRRSQHHPSTSNRARRSRQHDSRPHDETPSARGRGHQPTASYCSPPLEDGQQSYESPEIDMVTKNLAQAVNGYAGVLTGVWRRKDQDISYLEHSLQKQGEKVSNFQKDGEGKARRILELEDHRARLQERLESATQQLEDRSTKVTELQKKCRTYREHLNAATAEQQDLYKAAKAKCENAIKQMREEESKRMALDEQQRKDLQATRDRLTQMVKSTVSEYSLKEREFNNKLDSLHQKVQEREADIERERDTIRSLLEQNATVESVKGAVKTFEAQIEQITVKLGEIASSHVERDGTAAQETQAKLDKIVEHLSVLDKRVEPQANIIEKIQEVNVQTFSNILNPVLKSHSEIQANLQKLSDAVEDYMEDFWMKLEDREDVLTELLEQTQADNAQLQADVELREDECTALLGRLEEADAATRQREKDLENLKNDIAELEQAQANNMEQAKRAESLHEDCEKLKVDIAARVAVAHDLETRLQQSQAARLNETEQHKKHTQELQNLMEQRDKAAQAAQEAAVEVTRQEVTREMGIAKEKISTLLKQAEVEIGALKDELNAAKKQVSVVEETKKRADTTVDTLRLELKTTQAKANRLGEEASEKDSEVQKAFQRNSKQVADLKAKVARKEKEIAQLSEDAQTYDTQVQKALDSLKEWTKGHQDVKVFISELGKAQDGHLDNIDPKLKAVLEIDMFHHAIFQYFQAQRRPIPVGDQGTAKESTAGKDIWADLPPSSPQERMPPKNLAARVLDQVSRRVTIRSPVQSASSPVPLSVSAEQEHRRSANPPKSIMKAISQGTTIEDEDLAEPRAAAQSSSLPSRGFFGRRTYKKPALAKRALEKPAPQEDEERREQDGQDKAILTRTEFTRAPYNRPVSGIKTQAESVGIGDENLVGREPRKRKQADHGKVGLPSKRISVGSEKEKDGPGPFIHHLSPPGRQVSKGDEFQVAPNAPRKNTRRNSNVLDELNSPVPSFYFNQAVSTAGREARRKAPNHRGIMDRALGGPRTSFVPRANPNSQDASQGSQSLDYPRRRSSGQDEDSQNSITHSQQVTREPAETPYRARRFTMGQ